MISFNTLNKMFLMWLLFYLKEQGLFYILIMCETTKFLGYQWCIFFLWIPLPSPVPNYFWSQPEHPLDSIRYTYMTVPYKKDIYFCQFQVYKNKFRLWIQNKPHIKLAISYFLVRGGAGREGSRCSWRCTLCSPSTFRLSTSSPTSTLRNNV